MTLIRHVWQILETFEVEKFQKISKKFFFEFYFFEIFWNFSTSKASRICQTGRMTVICTSKDAHRSHFLNARRTNTLLSM